MNYARQIGASFILRGIRNEQDYAYERGMRYVNEEFDPEIQTVFLVPPRPLPEDPREQPPQPAVRWVMVQGRSQHVGRFLPLSALV